MNQQEIDRLFDKHGCKIGISKITRIMGREEFTSAIQESAAEIRRQAFDELPLTEIDHLLGLFRNHIGGDEETLDEDELELADKIFAARCALLVAIRALTEQEQEKS